MCDHVKKNLHLTLHHVFQVMDMNLADHVMLLLMDLMIFQPNVQSMIHVTSLAHHGCVLQCWHLKDNCQHLTSLLVLDQHVMICHQHHPHLVMHQVVQKVACQVSHQALWVVHKPQKLLNSH